MQYVRKGIRRTFTRIKAESFHLDESFVTRDFLYFFIATRESRITI